MPRFDGAARGTCVARQRALKFAGHQLGPKLPGATSCANKEPKPLKVMVIRTHFERRAVLCDCLNRIRERDDANSWKVNDEKTL